MRDIGAYCDHTILKASVTTDMIREVCEEAKKYKSAAVCVNPTHVACVREQLKGTGIKTCTVIGFPLGANKPEVKAFEAAEAVKSGADEVDMVINIGALRDGNYGLVSDDIRGVVATAKCKATVKVIIETCYLTKEEKEEACRICMEAGADYVKTSTGFGTGGATVEDVALIKNIVGDKLKIKASGGIGTHSDAEKLIAAGASRLGTSKTPHIVNGGITRQQDD